MPLGNQAPTQEVRDYAIKNGLSFNDAYDAMQPQNQPFANENTTTTTAKVPNVTTTNNNVPFANEGNITQAQLQQQAAAAEKAGTNQKATTTITPTVTPTPIPTNKTTVAPNIDLNATMVAKANELAAKTASINADIAKQKAAGLTGDFKTALDTKNGYIVKAYDAQNNEIYVKPGIYVKGASATPKDLSNFVDGGVGNIKGDNITKPADTIVNDIKSTVDESKPSVFEGIAANFTQNRDAEFSALEKERTNKLAEIDANQKILDEKLKSFDEATARAKQIEFNYQAAWSTANITGEWQRQQELLNGMQNLMTTTYQDTPNGTVPVSVLSRQNAGKFAGMNSMLEASKGYTTNAVSNMTSYFSEARLQNQNTASQIWNTVSLFENRSIALKKNVQDDLMKQIDVLQAQDTENFAKEQLITQFITAHPQAYSMSNINPDDNINTIVGKIGASQQQVDTFNKIFDKFQDAKITPDMTIAEMEAAVLNSPMYQADLAKTTSAMTDAQVFKRATEKMKEYIGYGKYISYDTAEAIVRGEQTVSTNYGSAFKDKLQSSLASSFASIKDDATKANFAQQFDAAIANNNIEAAVDVINRAAYEGTETTQKTKLDGFKSGIDLANNALNAIQSEKDVNLGAFTTWQNKAFNELNVSKDPVALRLKADISNATQDIRLAIYGTQITANEKSMLTASLPDLDKDTVADSKVKLEQTRKALAIKQMDLLTQYGGVDKYDEMGSVINQYQNNPSARAIIDASYANNPLTAPAEVLKDIQSVVGGPTNTDLENSAGKYDNAYHDIVNNAIPKLFTNKAAQKVALTYPQGTIGGQCGVFAQNITNRDYAIGDSYQQKLNTLKTKGVQFKDGQNGALSDRGQWLPKVGQTIVLPAPDQKDKNGNTVNYGHVAVIGAYNIFTNEITLMESNRRGDESVTLDRTIKLDKTNPLFNSIQGYLDTQLSPSFTY